MTDHEALLAAYGSPLYVYDLDRVHAALDSLRTALPAPSTLLYSLKANPHIDVVRTLVAGGCHAEVSSTGELTTALAAGCEPGNVFYTGPGKTAEEITTAVSAGVATFSVESPVDLRRVAAVASGLGRTVDCVLRVNGSDAPGSAGMRMTGESSQFGTDVEVLLERRAELHAPETDGARVVGFHFFPLTNAADEAGLVAEIQGSIRAAARLSAELGISLRLLDLGGGFACPFAQEGERPRYPGLRAPVEQALDEHIPGWRDGSTTVLFESGRHLVGDSGTLLCTVSDVKDSRGTRFAVLDTGINHLGGLSGIGRLLPLSAVPVRSGSAPAAAGRGEKVRLVGPLCTPADTLGRGAPELPPLAPGQALAIPNVGAYGATASLIGFLSRPAAAEVVLLGGEPVSATRLELNRVAVPARAAGRAGDAAVPAEGAERSAAGPVVLNGASADGTSVDGASVDGASVDGSPWDERFAKVLGTVLPRLGAGADLTSDSSLRAAGLDSLALVELLVQLEEAYDVTIPDDALAPEVFATPATLWELLQEVRGTRV
ncbi:phosphopantetheine-binding protein [Streptomyces sp. ACA25]|uniref:phosphopantetheine-binding protein n=1 Tax=Streptomyces sp. ACA25 TaxID=3022596 RepID=UPI002307A7A9|nr:phosphopantetheine-binding protein [Streptomyces sp. ACA25]MDB1089338.1 phosphopantetheine-binding protein [Streptomyces sp. ACA25]